ncbi:S-methyl-5-thioadenosine phosphorylase [Toensbergia leucococca]|nr:S-methyl-5-thioadenosine phosphorylase [Toensbergia leucococca]
MDSLPATYSDPIPIAVIGGTGLSTLPSPPFKPLALLPPPPTPWGLPSSPILVLSYTHPVDGTSESAKSTTIAFLSRHGLHHELAPHEVPSRANIAALRRLGVRCVVAFSAVGSLREEIKPRDFVVVDQILDWTKGVRPWTFFEEGVVGHVGFADPFDQGLREVIGKAVGKEGVLEGEGVKLHDGGTVVCIEGPQFSTRAESHLYRALSSSVINMSVLPEAKLAREAELAYAMICMSTDYDCWHASGESVSVEMVMGHMAANAGNAQRVVEAVLVELAEEGNAGVVWGRELVGSAKMAAGVSKGGGGLGRERLGWLFPGEF